MVRAAALGAVLARRLALLLALLLAAVGRPGGWRRRLFVRWCGSCLSLPRPRGRARWGPLVGSGGRSCVTGLSVGRRSARVPVGLWWPLVRAGEGWRLVASGRLGALSRSVRVDPLTTYLLERGRAAVGWAVAVALLCCRRLLLSTAVAVHRRAQSIDPRAGGWAPLRAAAGVGWLLSGALSRSCGLLRGDGVLSLSPRRLVRADLLALSAVCRLGCCSCWRSCSCSLVSAVCRLGCRLLARLLGWLLLGWLASSRRASAAAAPLRAAGESVHGVSCLSSRGGRGARPIRCRESRADGFYSALSIGPA